MNIGILPDAERSALWPQIAPLLGSAAERGGMSELLGEWELCWIVEDGGRVVAAATTRLRADDDSAEVILVGGKGWPEWLGDLSNMICSWARREGAPFVRAYGRKGWRKVLPGLGWAILGERNGYTGYERRLDG